MYNMEFPRSAFFALLAAQVISRVFVESQNQFTINSDKGKAMDEKYVFKTLVMDRKTMDHCLRQCLQDCVCISFQICHMTECQLCSSNKYENFTALQSKKGCTNFVFERQYPEENNQQSDRSCTTPINCCMTSNPCYNGGTCLPRDNYGQKARRFDCKCPDGYTGYRCQQPIRSCRGYRDGNRVAGKYKIFNINMTGYEVFCDFENSTMTWTLVQSNQRDQEVKALSYDNPLSQHNFSWNGYRLSKARMESIQKDSTMWRATCQYQEQGCSDLVRGFNDKMDILRSMRGCFEVEYINVHGQSCSNCTVYFRQTDRCTFHFSTRKSNYCEFNRQMERYHDQYTYFGPCYFLKRTTHCCSQSPTATTQIWFGGQ